VPARDAWTTYTEEHGLPGLQIQTVAAGPEGSVWAFVLWEGLHRFDGSQWGAVEGLNCGTVADIALEPDGTPWVATTGGMHYPGGCLYTLDGDEWRDVAGERGLAPIRTVALGSEGVVAAGTNLGLGIYQAGEWHLLRDGPTYDGATSVAVTPDGAAWFAFGDHSTSTHRPGVSRFDGQGWRYSLDEVEVTALAVAPDGSLWAGTVCDVRRFDGVAWKTVGQCGEDLPVGGINDVAFAADGALWVANGFGLARFDGRSWTLHEKLAHSVVAAPDGAIWINGWEGRQGSFYVARFDGEDWIAYKRVDSFPGGFSVGAVTPDGRLWGITPEGGLASFNGPSWSGERGWTLYPPAEGLSLKGIAAVAPDGALWLRASEGFARFDAEDMAGDRWTIYTAGDGQLCDGGYGDAIAFAPEGAIWFGTMRFQPARMGGVQ
jgi:ligand-binding sensor domain-containing protein